MGGLTILQLRAVATTTPTAKSHLHLTPVPPSCRLHIRHRLEQLSLLHTRRLRLLFLLHFLPIYLQSFRHLIHCLQVKPKLHSLLQHLPREFQIAYQLEVAFPTDYHSHRLLSTTMLFLNLQHLLQLSFVRRLLPRQRLKLLKKGHHNLPGWYEPYRFQRRTLSRQIRVNPERSRNDRRLHDLPRSASRTWGRL